MNLQENGATEVKMQLYTVREAAAMTRMSASWWRQRIFFRQIRFLKIGRRVLIPRETIDELLVGVGEGIEGMRQGAGDEKIVDRQ